MMAELHNKKADVSTSKIERSFVRVDTAAMVTQAPKYVCFGILKRALTIIEGIGGVGKSTLLYWICALLTLGMKFPDGTQSEPMNVAIIGIEDTPDMITEKLRLYQVDHSRIYLLPSMQQNDGKPWRFLIDQDAETLRQYIIENKIGVLYIDAIVSHVGKGNDLFRGQDARDVMSTLTEIASETGCAIIVTRHWKKGLGPASERGANSVEIRNVARGSMVVGLDPNNPDMHVLAPEKDNYRKRGGHSYGFRIESCNVTFGDGTEFDLGRVVPMGMVNITADDLALAEAKTSKQQSQSAIDNAQEAILQALREESLSAEDLLLQMKSTGHKECNFEKARNRLRKEGLIDLRRDGMRKGSKVIWSLTNQSQQSAQEASQPTSLSTSYTHTNM